MIKPKTAVVHKPEYRSILLLATRLVARRRSQNYAEKIKRGPTPHPRPDAQAANLTGTTRHNPVLGIRPDKGLIRPSGQFPNARSERTPLRPWNPLAALAADGALAGPGSATMNR